MRERSKIVTDKALRNELLHFDVDMTKFSDVVTFVARIIKVCDERWGHSPPCRRYTCATMADAFPAGL